MKKTTLCFCIDGDKVLLGMKKRGFGAEKWNGFGGKVKNETPAAATIRELKEESALVAKVEDLSLVAKVEFSFAGEPFTECWVYLLEVWQGEPAETKEMKPDWFDVADLPFQKMWAADAKWLPVVLSGKKITAKVDFSTDGNEVNSFAWEEALFD
ncbi:8-oxo-dGTP diphosphatase [Candidatus Kaiserbacteria bacterium]|nr:8-oxo-dGTP diphosphatase [Candidatus Kaiserbacteria bacterium]